MRTLIWFEIRKIVQKKSFVFAFVLLFGLQVFLAAFGAFGNEYIAVDRGQGETEAVFLRSFADRNKTDRSAGVRYTGTVFDEAFLARIREAFAPYQNEKDEAHRMTDDYIAGAGDYEIVLDRLKMYTGRYGDGYAAALVSSEKEFYALMQERREKFWDEYFLLGKEERAHWQEMQERQPDKLTFEYCYAWEEIIGMQGMYFTHMLLVFFFAVTMTFVFLNEVSRNTDQIILCTKKGRSQLYAAKLLAAELVSLVTTVLFALTLMAGRFLTYGPEGFFARFTDAVAPWYPGDLTMGQCSLIFLLVLMLSSVLITLIACLLSFVTKNGVASVSVLVAGLFAARLVPIPSDFAFIGKLWNTLPINILKWDEGFSDMRLFRVPWGWLTVWQTALILYAVCIAALIFAGKRIYCRTQISGR